MSICSLVAVSQPLSVGPIDTAGDVTLPGAKSWEQLEATVLFEKVLTSSDINPQGRIVVPKVSECAESEVVCNHKCSRCSTIFVTCMVTDSEGKPCTRRAMLQTSRNV